MSRTKTKTEFHTPLTNLKKILEQDPRKTNLVFLDDSGSTRNCRDYDKVFAHIAEQHDRATVFCFSSTIRPYHPTMREHDGTNIESIARLLGALACEGRQVKTLVILTDGNVLDHQITLSQTILEKNRVLIDEVLFYVKRTSSTVNLSVSAPFAAHAITSTFFDLDEDHKSSFVNMKIQDLLELIQSIQTRAQFQAAVAQIEQAIKIHMLVSKELEEVIKALKQMKARIIADMRESQVAIDFETATDEQVWSWWFNDPTRQDGMELEAQVDVLMQMCKTRTLNFNDLRSQVSAVALARQTDPCNVELPDSASEASGLGTCPILDDELLMCWTLPGSDGIFTIGENFQRRDPSRYNNALYNPFLALDYLEAHSGRFHSLELCKAVSADPITRAPLRHHVPLQNTPQSVEYGNWHIRHWLYQGKRIGNPTLVLLALYTVAQDQEYNQDHLPLLREHLLYRIGQEKCKIALSGLQSDPQCVVTIRRALRFCLGSDKYLKTMTFTQFEAFKEFAGLPEDLLDARWSMVQKLRDIAAVRSQKSFLTQLSLQATNQKYQDETFDYYVDAVKADRPDPATVEILSKISPTKSMDQCGIGSLDHLLQLDPQTVTPVCNYSYPIHAPDYRARYGDFNISPKTLWCSMKAPDGTDGIEYCRSWAGDRYLPAVREFIRLTLRLKKVPTLEEYSSYMTSKYDTLPLWFHEGAQRLLECYRQAIGDRSDEEVIRIMRSNMSRTERSKNEFSE